MLSTVRTVKQHYNPHLELQGVVFTMYDSRLKLTQQVVDEVEKYFPGKTYHTMIPRSVKLAEAPSYGKPVLYYEKYCKASFAYKKLADEVVKQSGGNAMANKKSGLGKGLGQLFLENSVDELVANNTLPLEEIVPNKEQPRKTFDETALEELAESIRQHGVLQPLLVRPLPGGGYQLVAGERRYRASRIAGLREVPVVIRELSDVETMEIAIIENLQREDLNPIEEAEGLQALIDRCGFTQDQVAASVGKSRPAIANSLRLLKLPPEVREMTKSGAISAGHARALLGLPNEALIYAAAEQIVSHKLTVRDVEKLAKRSQQEAGAAPKPRSRRDAFYDEVELALKETLGRKVRVVPGRGKGTLEIEFYSNEDLKDLANKLGE